MSTPKQTFSGQTESESHKPSQSSREKPMPVGPIESAPTSGQTMENRQPEKEAGGATGSAPSQAGFPTAFDGHLASLRQVRDQTNTLMKEYNPGHANARGSLVQIWQLLFDHISTAKPSELSEFNTLAMIIHRLSSSNTQLMTLELKLSDYEQERAEREEKKHKMLEQLQRKSGPLSLTPETLHEIERMLKLL
ncbi:hypothetical protein [Ruficoccus sp. ZRK36]|uniref:hypothetical protein n=1 Tax=Ruficoccus sp. ZRK36 TaxID=2866311 RepID=UPI001C72F2C2|nr:hypothetical protein [Ruficoccus sp. ZRK36]QYY34772.1 hypothetical protein K0V07_10710 [Ruficoccus sp. ZRK36]